MSNLDLLNALFGELSDFEPASYYTPLEFTLIAIYCDSNSEERKKILYTFTKMHRLGDESIGFDVLSAFHAIETYRYFDSALFLSHLKGLQHDERE